MVNIQRVNQMAPNKESIIKTSALKERVRKTQN